MDASHAVRPLLLRLVSVETDGWQTVDSRAPGVLPWSPPGRGSSSSARSAGSVNHFSCCLLTATIHPSSLHVVLRLRVIPEIVVAPWARLWPGDDASDIWIFTARGAWSVSAPQFGLVAPSKLLLLALLTCTLARAFLLGYFRSARHRVPSSAEPIPGQFPYKRRSSRTRKSAGVTGAGARTWELRGGAALPEHNTFGQPPAGPASVWAE